MEDENGLDLGLGLSCGGSGGKLKGKSGTGTSDLTAEDDKGSRIVGDFNDFLHGGSQKQDSGAGSQSDSVKPPENFFRDLSKASNDADASVNLSGKGPWVAGIYRPSETNGENQAEMSNKRRMPFDEINYQNKHGREVNYRDVHDKPKSSYISITTEDGSAADNEDVADSEVEGSTSRLAQHHDDSSKRFNPELAKEAHGFSDRRPAELQNQKRFHTPPENEFKLGNSGYGIPFSIQPMNMVNVSQSVTPRDSNSTPGTPCYPPAGAIQPVSPANLPMMFGYSPVQLPTMDKDHPWGLVPHAQQPHSSYAGKVLPNLASNQVVSCTSPEVTQYGGRMPELVKSEEKQHRSEEGSSTRTEEDAKGTAEGFSIDFSAIKPGIAADLKFGGCGSYPNLPWVSTTGPGPNGRTISGVTYRYSPNQIKIVCACHGTHMSPDEFVRHAAEEPANPDGGAGLSTLPNNNPAASAQS
ncbi:ninja-family protein mc410 [Rhodamnia argentea]|uniref:Ninja-family protein n=1 Tax=Rhodamnia argentea TaxID=178133 RepID=A0A8B8Q5W7_9MYRT|nr:ninja-family protein mc410 [Rhodamnia argentea]XP_048133188.1 ninja-family protein mc410 [Rhodamnia argentea]XP_048133189.1 ninja-family protein mc410 [Rhodamnia argentea]XP_048133190.1 ninja-family protein mc410 [Rhodamnia argentea]